MNQDTLHVPAIDIAPFIDPATYRANVDRMIAAIKKAGGKPEYTELPGVGHGSWGQAYRPNGVLRWMFEQKR